MSYNNVFIMKLVKDLDKNQNNKPKVSDKEAEEAFKLILKWIGEDPKRGVN